eukprot:1158300-Pelagomonas_calceolata.AAC.2
MASISKPVTATTKDVADHDKGKCWPTSWHREQEQCATSEETFHVVSKRPRMRYCLNTRCVLQGKQVLEAEQDLAAGSAGTQEDWHDPAKAPDQAQKVCVLDLKCPAKWALQHGTPESA